VSEASGAGEWLVACLCAEWCGSCRDYRAVFEAAHGEHPAARFAWVDIEDHPDVLGPVDVENFPSLIIARGDEIAFFGTVTPHAATLNALVGRATAGELGTVDDPELAGVPARIRALVI
jgi:thiol-disulfide isomerase/thioredoxin